MNQAQRQLVIDHMLDIWENEDRWCKDRAAIDRFGQAVNADDYQAVAWCLLGCMTKSMQDLGLYSSINDFTIFTDDWANHDFGVAAASWNDYESTTFEDVRLWVKRLGDATDLPPGDYIEEPDEDE